MVLVQVDHRTASAVFRLFFPNELYINFATSTTKAVLPQAWGKTAPGLSNVNKQ